MSMQRRKGTAWETACTVYLRRAFGDDERTIHRSALHGRLDEGDIHGLKANGGKVVVECKNAKQPRYGEWVEEAEDEAWNADALYGVVFAKRHGLGIQHVGQHLAIMSIDCFIRLIGGEVPSDDGEE